MRNILITIATVLTELMVLMFFTGAARIAAADEPFAVKGTLVDALCFKKDGAAKALSADHLACAKDCAKKGSPVGVFVEGMGLVRITGDYPTKNTAKVLDLMGKQVEAKGSRVRGNDYTYLIEVTTLTPAK